MDERYRLVGLLDRDLLSGLVTLVQRGNAITADLLAHLAEVGSRRLHLELGFPSLFAYCTEKLGMSESSAGRRIVSARICARFPGQFVRIASGELQMSVLCALNPYLTGENADELFEACAGKSRRDVERVLAARFPKPDVPQQVRRLPATARKHQGHAIEPLSLDRFGVRFTADSRLTEKIELARALARHRLPNGDLAALTELAYDALIEQLKKQRFAVGRKPRGAPRERNQLSPGESATMRRSRHISAGVAREVYDRDGGQCAFVSASGKRCETRAFLEIDHRHPWAAGGSDEPGNLRLCCHAHNQLEARNYFGSAHVDAAAAAAAAR